MLNLARIKIVFPFLSLVKSVYAANFVCLVVEPFHFFFSSAVLLTSFAFLLLGRLLPCSELFSREGDVVSVFINLTRCYFKESSRFQSLLLLLHCFRLSLCFRRMLFRSLLDPSGLFELSACFFFFVFCFVFRLSLTSSGVVSFTPVFK